MNPLVSSSSAFSPVVFQLMPAVFCCWLATSTSIGMISPFLSVVLPAL
jgi:hypothetical protein